MNINTSVSRLLSWGLATIGVCLAPGALAQDVSPDVKAAYRRPHTIPFPKDNPYTPEKAALGKMLFFDARLSRDKNLSCASCHNPSFGWEVPFATAIGAGGKPLGRHAPTALNLAWTSEFFWDGRAKSLEAQARGPIEAPVEMDLPLATAVTRLKEVQGYADAFAKAFPKEGLTEATVLKAIGTFERTIVTGITPFDRWVKGDQKAIKDDAKRGFALFVGKARCASCHTGWNFTDGKFHDIGLATTDQGRMAVSGQASDQHAFKTPSLREIAARAPYMHSGQVPSLEATVAHYLTGGIQRPSLAKEMKPIQLNGQEMQDLVAFLRTLSSPQTVQTLPNLPPQ